MKKLILIAFSALLFMLSVNAPALADGVVLTYEADFDSPDSVVIAEKYFPFRGTKRVVFEVAGKTCDLLGSASPIGAFQGCNYKVTIAADGTLSGTGNYPCTEDVAAACK
ncbi:hypothetical protein [Moorena sp. SIO4G3]|uniref:hypothetical protein n=1 Tax=Moorena sp. SIO4G3 TaxID=2607821 RepID=UPI00142AA505|nr:hypothetical protein [Moorena sp. SIO4G3]NEO79412.1 hypothetical protein [Moorena sp. SIO4G3]